MTNANIEMPDGTKVTIEGSPEEVARTVKLLKGSTGDYSKTSHKTAKSPRKPPLQKRTGIIGRIRDLNDEGFFKKQKNIQEIKEGLAEKGHIYPVTSLSPALVRLVRSREMRRIKHNNKWAYVEA